MSIEGTVCANMRVCASCGAGPSEQIWIGVADGICAECRMGRRGAKSDALAVAKREAGAESTLARAELAGVLALEIADQEGLELAAGALAEVKGRAKRLEAREKEITGPMRTALESVRDLFREPREALAAIEEALKGKIADATLRFEEEATAAQERALEAAQRGDAVTALAVMSAARELRKIEGLSTRDAWTFEISDPGAVPRALCSPDPKLVRVEMARQVAAGETPEIPGVRFQRSVRVASRSM